MGTREREEVSQFDKKLGNAIEKGNGLGENGKRIIKNGFSKLGKSYIKGLGMNDTWRKEDNKVDFSDTKR